ncbi:unnamed protein product [Closterium sp. Naga37s-1]|nr:unnamed protein product [Closterium sp. Naga37s-1]
MKPSRCSTMWSWCWMWHRVCIHTPLSAYQCFWAFSSSLLPPAPPSSSPHLPTTPTPPLSSIDVHNVKLVLDVASCVHPLSTVPLPLRLAVSFSILPSSPPPQMFNDVELVLDVASCVHLAIKIRAKYCKKSTRSTRVQR